MESEHDRDARRVRQGASDYDKGHKEGVEQGRQDYRKRCQGIIDSPAAKVRPRAALAAIVSTEMGQLEAQSFLASLPEEKGTSAGGESTSDFSRAERALQASGRFDRIHEVGGR